MNCVLTKILDARCLTCWHISWWQILGGWASFWGAPMPSLVRMQPGRTRRTTRPCPVQMPRPSLAWVLSRTVSILSTVYNICIVGRRYEAQCSWIALATDAHLEHTCVNFWSGCELWWHVGQLCSFFNGHNAGEAMWISFHSTAYPWAFMHLSVLQTLSLKYSPMSLHLDNSTQKLRSCHELICKYSTFMPIACQILAAEWENLISALENMVSRHAFSFVQDGFVVITTMIWCKNNLTLDNHVHICKRLAGR